VIELAKAPMMGGKMPKAPKMPKTGMMPKVKGGMTPKGGHGGHK
jgi:hypothetical protein